MNSIWLLILNYILLSTLYICFIAIKCYLFKTPVGIPKENKNTNYYYYLYLSFYRKFPIFKIFAFYHDIKAVSLDLLFGQVIIFYCDIGSPDTCRQCRTLVTVKKKKTLILYVTATNSILHNSITKPYQ